MDAGLMFLQRSQAVSGFLEKEIVQSKPSNAGTMSHSGKRALSVIFSKYSNARRIIRTGSRRSVPLVIREMPESGLALLLFLFYNRLVRLVRI
jgi:hypothetical protein